MELIQKFKTEDWWNDLSEGDFQKSFHMDKKTLINLQAEIDNCEEISDDAVQEEIYNREQISDDRIDPVLLACIWLLSNTKPFEEAENYFNIRDIENVFENYLPKIIKLGSSYIVWPTLHEAKILENNFTKEYGFPKVMGVVGSLHVEVNIKEDCYYNEAMKKYTIVLQVVCDNNLLLRNMCVGCPGGKSIKDILETSPLFQLLTDKNSSLCKNKLHLLGGTQHPQLETLLTPYKYGTGGKLNENQCRFNSIHNKAMVAVEKTFMCLENRFPRINCADHLSPEFASLIASTVCILHNFTRICNDNCNLYLCNG